MSPRASGVLRKPSSAKSTGRVRGITVSAALPPKADSGGMGHSPLTSQEVMELGQQSGAVVGSDGFGYAPDAEHRRHKIPQIGIVEVGDDVEIDAGPGTGVYLAIARLSERRAARIGDLEVARGRPVFIYCRTGNRSTVAARQLIDAGFSEVINLRRGIVDWERQGMPVVK